MQRAKELNRYYRIAAATLNKYHRSITMEGADVDLFPKMIERSRMLNVVQARVETRRNG